MTKISKFELKNYIEFAENSIISKKIVENPSGGLTLFAFDKDQRLSEHTAPFDAVVNVINGKAKITIADEEFELTEGEMIVMPANIPHAVYALDKFKMLLTMIK